MKRGFIIALVAVAALAAAYLTGFLQERSRATALERERDELLQRMQTADDRLRMAGLLGQLLELTDQTNARNYGEAGNLATRYFDAARDESVRVSDGAAKQALAEILASRDTVTGALARSDPSIVAELQKEQHALRDALKK
jgi:hypothetical protein